MLSIHTFESLLVCQWWGTNWFELKESITVDAPMVLISRQKNDVTIAWNANKTCCESYLLMFTNCEPLTTRIPVEKVFSNPTSKKWILPNVLKQPRFQIDGWKISDPESMNKLRQSNSNIFWWNSQHTSDSYLPQ